MEPNTGLSQDNQPQTSTNQARPASEHWSAPFNTLPAAQVRKGVLSLNMQGRRLSGPLQGFGRLWEKTFRMRLSGVQTTPAEVVQIMKEKLPELLPPDSPFYPSLKGIQPGELVVINTTVPLTPGGVKVLPGGLPVSTGVLVLYADDTTFTVMTPQGHPESGFNTFSAYEEDGAVVAEIKSLCRPADPIYEFGHRFMGGSATQDRIWTHVLSTLAGLFKVEGQVNSEKVLIDSRLQWKEARNIWYNAILRTVLFTPVRLWKRAFQK